MLYFSKSWCPRHLFVFSASGLSLAICFWPALLLWLLSHPNLLLDLLFSHSDPHLPAFLIPSLCTLLPAVLTTLHLRSFSFQSAMPFLLYPLRFLGPNQISHPLLSCSYSCLFPKAESGTPGAVICLWLVHAVSTIFTLFSNWLLIFLFLCCSKPSFFPH